MIVDSTAAARRADPGRVREWLAEQRVFISSAMADTAAERRAVAEAVEDEGARAVWFEEFGRDADAEEAYLTEVDFATIYVGVLNEIYGRLNPPGHSATEAEYLRARERGKRVSVLIAADAPGREGHLTRFIERVRFHNTTETYADVDDLARRVRRRLHELADEALSPWVKLGNLVFRADAVDDAGDSVSIVGRVSDEIAHQLETMRDLRFGRTRLRFVHRSRVAAGELVNVRRTTRAGGADEVAIELGNVRAAEVEPFRVGTSGLSAEQLVELGMRQLFLGEPLPASVSQFESLADTGIDVDDLRQAFDQPNETAEAIARLVVVHGLVGGGRARRLTTFTVGPRNDDVRRFEVEWEDPRVYSDAEPERRRLEGEWRRPS
jgi:hypothetical protein